MAARKWLDRVLSRVGLRRMKNSAIEPGTETFQILWDWINSPLRASQSVDWEFRSKIRSLRASWRQLALNNPIICQYLALLKQNVIGHNGMRLQAQVRNNDGNLNKAINDKIEAACKDWWRSPWLDGRLSGVQGEQLLIQTLAVDGEAFVRRVLGSRFKYGIRLQMIDASLVDHTLNQTRGGGYEGVTNEIRLGVEVDTDGAVMAFWLWQANPEGDLNSGAPQKRVRVPASEIIHLYDPQRIAQTRGLGRFISIAVQTKILDGFVEASLLAARTAACAFPLFKHTDPIAETDTPPQFNIDLNPGRGLTIPRGLEMQSWDPKQPNLNFGEFTKEGKRWLSCGLRVSYNALANDLEGVNYSSMRSGLLIERDGWRCDQQMWIDRFKYPVHEWFIPAALLSGDLVLDSRDPRKFLAAKFIPRGWPWVDPLKDISAAIMAIENLMGSRTGALAEEGKDFEEICEELKGEKAIAEQHKLNLASEPGKSDNPADPGNDGAGEGATNPGKDKKALRLAILNCLLDDEDIDALRLNSLMKRYRADA